MTIVSSSSRLAVSGNHPSSGVIGGTPAHIEPKHWYELVIGSGISPAIAAANFESLHAYF